MSAVSKCMSEQLKHTATVFLASFVALLFINYLITHSNDGCVWCVETKRPQRRLSPMSTAPKPKPKLAAPADCDLVNVNYSYYCLSWFVFSLSKCRIHFCDMCQRFLACSFFQQWCYTTLWSFVDRRGSTAWRCSKSWLASVCRCRWGSVQRQQLLFARWTGADDADDGGKAAASDAKWPPHLHTTSNIMCLFLTRCAITRLATLNIVRRDSVLRGAIVIRGATQVVFA